MAKLMKKLRKSLTLFNELLERKFLASLFKCVRLLTCFLISDGAESFSYYQLCFTSQGSLHLSRRVSFTSSPLKRKFSYSFSTPQNFSPFLLSHRHQTQLVIWLQILQEWTGISIITVFQSLIFLLAGYDARKTGLLSGINTITYMFSTLVSVFTLDRWGRRVVLFYGAVLQGFALMMAGVFIHLVKTQPQHAANLGAGATFMVFML